MGGKWDSDGFTAHCKGPKCSGLGVKDYDFGLTGLSLLAFLDAGKAAAPGEFAKVVKNGVLFLKVLQNEKGFIGARIGGVPMYDHTISTLALCRTFSADPSLPLKKTIRKALDYISNARNPYAAWRYYPRYENDTSVTGWVTITLATAWDAGWKSKKEDFQGAAAWFRAMTDPRTGRVGYTEPGSPPARSEEMADKFPSEKSESLTALALEARLRMGMKLKRKSPLEKAVGLLLKAKPAWEKGSIDMYYWFFGTRALALVGGRPWKEWRKAVLNAVMPHQRKSGCARGSWDPVGAWGTEGGRIYSTALMVGVLETCLKKRGERRKRSIPSSSFPVMRPEYLAKILEGLAPKDAAELIKGWMPRDKEFVIRIFKAMKHEKALTIFGRLPFKMGDFLKKKLKEK